MSSPLEKIKSQLSNAIIDSGEIKKTPWIKVDKGRLVEVCRKLQDEGYTYLLGMGITDWIKEEKFEVNIYLRTQDLKETLLVKAEFERDKEKIPSLIEIWPPIDFHEREAHEMFGVEYSGRPKPERLLLPENWPGGHPLRKDYKLGE